MIHPAVSWKGPGRQRTSPVMFNRNNLPSVPNPFGARTDNSGRPSPRDTYGSPNQAPTPPRQSGYDTRTGAVGGGYLDRGAYGPPKESEAFQRKPVGRQGPSGGGAAARTWQLRPAKSPDNAYIFGNLYAAHLQRSKRHEITCAQCRCISFGYSANPRWLGPLFVNQRHLRIYSKTI